jgi:hypothetical protein
MASVKSLPKSIRIEEIEEIIPHLVYFSIELARLSAHKSVEEGARLIAEKRAEKAKKRAEKIARISAKSPRSAEVWAEKNPEYYPEDNVEDYKLSKYYINDIIDLSQAKEKAIVRLRFCNTIYPNELLKSARDNAENDDWVSSYIDITKFRALIKF